jgi:hypothetical protein
MSPIAGKRHFTTYSLTITAGLLPLHATNHTGKFYRTEKEVFIKWGGVLGGNYPVNAGIFIPNDASRTTEVFYGGGGASNAPTASEQHPGIEFKPDTYQHYDANAFKRELVYSGVSNNVVSILYREYINDLARPAFSQDLKYDLAQGDVIGFKGARFQIIKATNLTITYKVLKPLE